MPNTQEKDATLAALDSKGFKVIRRDYLVEVMGVPLSLSIGTGPRADNSDRIKEILQANRRNIGGLQINRIQ